MLVLEEIRPSMVVGDEAGDPAAFFGKTPPDESFTLPVTKVEEMIDVVSAMHMQYLNQPRLLELPWIFGSSTLKSKVLQPEVEMITTYIPKQWTATRASAAAGLYMNTPWSDEFMSQMDHFVESLPQLFYDHFTDSRFPYTIVHGDYHTANVLRVLDPSTCGRAVGSLVILDFQVRGAPVHPTLRHPTRVRRCTLTHSHATLALYSISQ